MLTYISMEKRSKRKSSIFKKIIKDQSELLNSFNKDYPCITDLNLNILPLKAVCKVLQLITFHNYPHFTPKKWQDIQNQVPVRPNLLSKHTQTYLSLYFISTSIFGRRHIEWAKTYRSRATNRLVQSFDQHCELITHPEWGFLLFCLKTLTDRM